MSRTLSIRSLALLGALYFAQGLPFGFFQQALPVLALEHGLSLEAVGFGSLLVLPWALKFLWAPWVDRFWWPRLGRRRSWLLPLQVGLGVSLVLMALLPPERSFWGVLLGVLWINFLCATQDIPTDGLAVALIPEEKRGLGNGLQVGAYRLGMILSGGAMLAFYTRLGWGGSFLGMGLVVLLATLPLLWFREPGAVSASDKSPLVVGSDRGHFLRQPGAWSVIALLVVYKFGEHFATSMLRPFLKHKGLGLEDLGVLLGTVGSVAGLLGAFLGGALLDKLGQKRALLLFGLLQAMTVAGYAWLAQGPLSWGWLYGLTAAEYLCGGMATASLFACMMAWCRPGREGEDYTTQASAVVIASALASVLSGFSAARLGYEAQFWLSCVLAAGAVLWVWFRFPRRRGV
jgi:MFS family permease